MDILGSEICLFGETMAPHTPIKCAHIMKNLRKDGHTYDSIAQVFNVSKTCVWKILNPSVKARHNRKVGRPAHYKKATRIKVKEFALKEKLSCRQITRQLNAKNNEISLSTVHRILKNDKNIEWIHSKPRICLSEASKKARMEWAFEYVDFGVNWDQVVWSDEKKFNLFRSAKNIVLT